jgi:hypothetical protein
MPVVDSEYPAKATGREIFWREDCLNINSRLCFVDVHSTVSPKGEARIRRTEDKAMASFSAYCPHCEKTVTTNTMLAGSQLKAALKSDGKIQVIHVSDVGDHVWNLIAEEKENLQKRIIDGTVAA